MPPMQMLAVSSANGSKGEAMLIKSNAGRIATSSGGKGQGSLQSVTVGSIPAADGASEDKEGRVDTLLQINKALGPDPTTTELFIWVDRENKEHLLGILNACWNNEYFPDEALTAKVASIFKKGDTKKLENYKHISLLNTLYKFMASILQKRLVKGNDK